MNFLHILQQITPRLIVKFTFHLFSRLYFDKIIENIAIVFSVLINDNVRGYQ